MSNPSRVLLAIPHYSPRIDVRVLDAAYRNASRQPERFTITVNRRGQSLLANGVQPLSTLICETPFSKGPTGKMSSPD